MMIHVYIFNFNKNVNQFLLTPYIYMNVQSTAYILQNVGFRFVVIYLAHFHHKICVSLTLKFMSFYSHQIFIGVVSNLIVFPVNFLLVFLFKKSRPHYKRPSRIDLAIKEVQDQHKHASINDVKPEV